MSKRLLLGTGILWAALGAMTAAQTAPAPPPAAATAKPDLVGTWRCEIDYQGGPIAVGIHIVEGDGGQLTGTADSVDGNSPAMPVQVALDSDTVHLFVSGVEAAFTGKINAASDAIDGAWTVGDANLACVLKRDKTE